MNVKHDKCQELLNVLTADRMLVAFLFLSSIIILFLFLFCLFFLIHITGAENSSKDGGKPVDTAEKHDELFDAIASLFPDKGLMGAEVHRR